MVLTKLLGPAHDGGDSNETAWRNLAPNKIGPPLPRVDILGYLPHSLLYRFYCILSKVEAHYDTKLVRMKIKQNLKIVMFSEKNKNFDPEFHR